MMATAKPGAVLEKTDPAANSADDRDVRLAQGGDRTAFDRLVLRHQDDVVTAATYFLGDAEDGVDTAQEAFLRAFRGLSAFRGRASFKTWLLRITLNTARSLRSRQRALKRSGRTIRLGEADDETGGRASPVDVPDPNGSCAPATLLERKEVKEALELSIAQLDDESREVIVLRDIAGESYEAMAAGLGIPVGTVKSRVHRARLEIRKRITRYL